MNTTIQEFVRKLLSCVCCRFNTFDMQAGRDTYAQDKKLPQAENVDEAVHNSTNILNAEAQTDNWTIDSLTRLIEVDLAKVSSLNNSSYCDST